MIGYMVAFKDKKGHYGRTWGPERYTDIGLEPSDWENNPISHMIYTPIGYRLEIGPEQGYRFKVTKKDGGEIAFDKGWNLIYYDIDEKWYSQSIKPENEVKIETFRTVIKTNN